MIRWGFESSQSNIKDTSRYRIVVITTVFQTVDGVSITPTCSKYKCPDVGTVDISVLETDAFGCESSNLSRGTVIHRISVAENTTVSKTVINGLNPLSCAKIR